MDIGGRIEDRLQPRRMRRVKVEPPSPCVIEIEIGAGMDVRVIGRFPIAKGRARPGGCPDKYRGAPAGD